MSKMRSVPRAAWLVVALLVAVPLILYWPFVFGGKVLFWGTPLLQFWPWRTFAAQELRAGRLPLWNPYSGNGTPLLADHQSAVLYPLNLIFWVLPVERAMGLSLVLHAIVAGVTTYALARELGLTRCGGTVAALAFMLSGYMVARGSFLTEVSALPWLPLLWLYGWRVMRRRRLRDLVLLSVAIALQFLAGHAQTWFYSLVALALCGLWEGWLVAMQGRDPGSIKPQTWGRLRRWVGGGALLALAVVWGTALSAAQFLPTLELSRMAGRAARTGWGEYALQYSLWPWRLLTLLLPDLFGNPAHGNYWGYATYWEDAGYIGVLPSVFAILAVLFWGWRRLRRREMLPVLRHVPLFALLALFALLMALGKNTPFYMLFFRYVPGFGTFQAPARWLCVYTPAMALLAGIGVDGLRPSRRLTFVCRLAAVGAVGIALTALAAKWLLAGVKATFFDPMIQFAALLAGTMGLILWGQPLREGKVPRLGPLHLRTSAWQVVVALFVAADLIYAGWHLNPAADPSLYHPDTEIGAFLAGDGPQGRTFYPAEGREEVMWGRYLSFEDYGPTDAAHWREVREAQLPDTGIVERLPSANSFEPLVEARYYSLLETAEDLPGETALRVLGLMNVAYVLDPSPDLGLELAYRSPSVNVYRNPALLPRAYVVCDVRLVSSSSEAMEVLASPTFDPTREVVLEADLPQKPATPDAGHATCDPQPATLLPSLPNRATIRAVLPKPGYLILADTFYPGWQAYVDGQRVDVLRANYAFRAVQLGAGTHEVQFRYRPWSFAIGVACSALALICAVVAWVLSRKRDAELTVS